jgi:broad specificity phosphatase PhoE
MIIIVRHGQTLWNVLKKLQGHRNSKLTVKGNRQAIKVAKFFDQKIKKIEDFKIYSSPIKRVVDYTNVINSNLKNIKIKNKIIYSNYLKEHNFGKWEGKSIKEIKKKFPDEFQNREIDKWNFKVPNGESYSVLNKRVKKFIKKEISLRKKYIIFTHEMVSKVFRGVILNLDKKKIMRLKHNSDYVFIYKNKKFKKTRV